MNNMEGVCALKKSWLFKAYGPGMVGLGPCRDTQDEAKADAAVYAGPGKAWVEQVPARYRWTEK